MRDIYLSMSALISYGLAGIGAILIWIRNPENPFIRLKAYRCFYGVFLACLAISWGCSTFLLVTSIHFNKIQGLLGPPLMFITAFYWFQVIEGWRGWLPDVERESNLFLAYWICMSVLGGLIALQIFSRYIP